MNAALFEQLALQWTDEIFEEKDVLVMVGGTGLYIKAFCDGLDDMPPVSMEQEMEFNWTMKKRDQMVTGTGQRKRSFILYIRRNIKSAKTYPRTGSKIIYRQFNTFLPEKISEKKNFRYRQIGLQLPKDQLHRNIDARVESMMEQGLASEVKELLPWRHLNSLRTVGYTELFDWIDGKIALEQAVDLIKKNTRQYAKRQNTWFRKDHSIQ